MKYILNHQYSLDTIDSIEFREEFKKEALDQQNKFILACESKKSVLLINKVIFEFLTLFIGGNSLENAINEYSKIINCIPKDIESKFLSFFNQMKRKKILIKMSENISSNNEQNFIISDNIKGYQVLELIVNKGSAEIYKVKDNQNRILVFKLVHKNKFNIKAEFVEAELSLKQEYNFLRKLSVYPNIFSPVDYFSSEEYACLVLTYIKGTNLGVFIRNGNLKTSYTDKLIIIKSILKTLSVLNEKNILHGDIHASNFIISNQDVTILDFGHSQNLNPENSDIIKKGGVVCYMPPERINNDVFGKFKNDVTVHSEVYQTGILTYMLVYENEPFNGLTCKNIINKILYEEPVLNNSTPMGEKIHPKIISFIRKAIEKTPNKRHRSVSEMYKLWQELWI